MPLLLTSSRPPFSLMVAIGDATGCVWTMLRYRRLKASWGQIVPLMWKSSLIGVLLATCTRAPPPRRQIFRRKCFSPRQRCTLTRPTRSPLRISDIPECLFVRSSCLRGSTCSERETERIRHCFLGWTIFRDGINSADYFLFVECAAPVAVAE